MVRLSVNINKIATIRNARGGSLPDVVKAAIEIQRFGAQGITVHPRPDARHITYKDVRELRPVVSTEFNVEGYPSDDFLTLVTTVVPDQVTLVPDPPGVITSNAGWDTVTHQKFLQKVVDQLHSKGIRVSLFTDTKIENIEAAKDTGADRIELYTEPYVKVFLHDPESAVQPFVHAAKVAAAAGLGVNAGHDLNLHNLGYFASNIPELLEVSIGHALISDALYFGLENTVMLYRRALSQQ